MNNGSRILAGRYEVGDLIGRGGMAEVHIGYDTRLGRTVAIKILRSDLARDPSFQTRFRREAQAAAGLNHPAIVAVYDTGEEQVSNADGTPQAVPFIVMEYVEGHTVRDILKGDVAAPIEEAVEITQGVLSALDYAHHAGLVHRDIKPANVMLTPTGAVKVMDFGIARALADAGQTMTQTQAVVGTAQYLSPEQARGENVDARSDLYSTGCLLFELLTGRPPFIGDSPVSVAYQHVREEAPLASQYASDVPAALDQVVAQSLRKGKDERFSTAQEFSMALDEAMGVGGAPTTGATAVGSAAWGAGAAGVANAQDELSGEQPVAPAQPETGATAVMPAAAGGWGSVMGGPPNPPHSVVPTSTAVATDEELIEDDSTKRRILQIGIMVAAIVGAALLIWALFALTSGGGEETEPTVDLVTVPTLQNQTEEDATTRLEALGLVVEVETAQSEDVPIGRVIGTTPEAGEQVEPGSTVTLTVSTGPDEVLIPDVRGLLQNEAVRELELAGLTVSLFEVDHDPNLQAERATRTVPEAGTTVASGTEITLYVSDGQVELPELRDLTENEARQILIELNLNPVIEDEETDEFEPGTVIEMDPLPGLVPQGTSVTMRVAVAPRTVLVPNVVGRSQSNATADLAGVGLNANVTTTTHPTVPSGQVISQNPSAGIEVTVGSTVTISVSTGPPDPDPTPTPTAGP